MQYTTIIKPDIKHFQDQYKNYSGTYQISCTNCSCKNSLTAEGRKRKCSRRQELCIFSTQIAVSCVIVMLHSHKNVEQMRTFHILGDIFHIETLLTYLNLWDTFLNAQWYMLVHVSNFFSQHSNLTSIVISLGECNEITVIIKSLDWYFIQHTVIG